MKLTYIDIKRKLHKDSIVQFDTCRVWCPLGGHNYNGIVWKWCKPDNFESHNSLKRSFTDIWGLSLEFSFFKMFKVLSNLPDIRAVCETNLDDSIVSENFSVMDYLPLIWKDPVTHMHGFAVYVKEGLPFPWEISWEDS